MNYLWDDRFQLFRREVVEEFPYSDGLESESRLLDVVRAAKDRGTFSRELAESIGDWPSEYHFSRSRHCLVRPLGIGAGHRVLELGCGCGAITRFLGETGAEVVAVEASLMRARIAAERCRDLGNVRVVVDNLTQFSTDERFDYVLFIGVLEYAAVFSDHESPFEHHLRTASRLLAAGGRIVVAIENQLGLKYFNGCGEDHVGIPFFGVQDLYRPQAVRTFGRRQLLTQLSAAGLPHIRFYYPFPDYKLPSVILSEEALTDAEFDPVDMLARCHSRDYTGSVFRSFDEALVFSAAHKNGLLADLSNSFLAVAMPERPREEQRADLAVAYSVNRAAQFAVQTRLFRKGSRLQVLKEPLLLGPGLRTFDAAGITFTLHFPESGYIPGRQLFWKLLKARVSSAELEPSVEALRPWFLYLMDRAGVEKAAAPSSLAAYVLPGSMLDCTPFNLMESDGNLVSIDTEWQTEGDIALGWVVARGILWSLGVCLTPDGTAQSIFELIEALCGGVGLLVSSDEVQGWLDQEADLQAIVTGRPRVALGMHSTSWTRIFAGEIASLREKILASDRKAGNLQDALSARDQESQLKDELIREREHVIRLANDSLDQSEQLVGELNRTVADLTEVQTSLKRQLEETNAERLRLRAELDCVLSSRIWRYTAVARHLKEWMGSLRLGNHRQHRKLHLDRQVMANSGFFDANWYLEHNPDVASAGVDPLTHYLEFGAAELRDPGPKFSNEQYLEQYPDVQAAGLNPLLHYLKFGIAEGRRAFPTFDHEPVELPTATADVFSYMSKPVDFLALPKKVFVGVSSRGNFFMTEIARTLEHAFKQLGVESVLVNESEACSLPMGITMVAVAPHEFFHLGDGPKAFETLKRSSRIVMVNTEQPQTQWFSVAQQYFESAIAILDINFEAARHLQASGYRAFALPLGYSEYIARTFDGKLLPRHELHRFLPPHVIEPLPATYDERPIDLMFIGTASARRQGFFARHAAFFASKNTILYMPDGDRPFLPLDSRTVDFATATALVRRSKILLNIHRDEVPYLEWQRIVTLGILQRTLVVSDHCSPNPCVTPNLDYLEGPLDALPSLCDSALSNGTAAEQFASAAYHRMKEHYPVDQVLGRCWTALVRAVGGPQ